MEGFSLGTKIVVWIFTAIVIAGIIGTPLFFIGLLVYSCNRIECNAVGKKIELKTEYSFWAGCIVEKPNGQKVLLEQMRNIQ